ncbi:nucleotide exchange factor GrpE [Patulibacter sp.]|uniref:nucleotide exchange factor GrpE n=1 Tax=Patulibacter sp. TaxID=1912859 RepID=UPI00271ED9CA|nr:nucleotide exchange factor GrpE [Patulibacter sp.]MDO9410934.1 nucleotide exchange factor GrpE [Patulibacter sp.]
MSEQPHDPKPDARTAPDGPKPAPSGTGPGGVGDRPIPADGVPGGGGNAPDDGSTPGDMDGDALDGAAGTAGPSADPRTPEAEDGEGDPEDPAASAEAGEDDGAPAEDPGAAEPTPEEPDWKDRYVRSVAELDNVRKRARRDAAAGEARGIARLAKELLPALDNLDRALAHVDAEPGEAGGGDAQLVEGLRIVHREIHAALSQAGIEAYDPTGEQFDPFSHEALTQQPAPEGTPSGTILAVYQAGYRRGDDVLRAAKVVVAG